MVWAAAFLFISGCCVFQAISRGGWSYLWFWPSASFLLIATAYLTQRASLLGKRSNGSIAIWAWLVHLPFFVYTHATWHLQRLYSREPAVQEIVPGLWLGRRPLSREVRPHIEHIVDLTAEFPVSRGTICHRYYRCLPTLDASVPPQDQLAVLAIALRDQPNILIYCAQGHGRSAMLVAILLVQRGMAPDILSAEQMIRKIRPAVRINSKQKRLAEVVVKRLQ